jgi:DNA-binding transcriptional LysR family regulator
VGDDEPLTPDLLAPVEQDVRAWGAQLRRTALAGQAAQALEALDTHRLLCAHRRGPRGVQHWEWLATRWLAQDRADEATLPRADGRYPGEPLLVTTNDYEINLFNGDTGVVVADPGRGMRAWFARGGQPTPVALVRLGDVRPVHAMTVHRSQGSQFERVTVVLPTAGSPLATRETLYTAITRAVSHVRVVGSAEAFAAAVARPAARATGLRERLETAASGYDGCERMSLDPRRLLVLRAVHRHGGVLAASERLGLTPSAVSQHLAKLEAETGLALVDRSRLGGGRSLVLTAVGRAVSEHADDLAAALAAAEQTVATVRGAASGPVAVGAFPTAIRRLVAPAVASLQASHPAVHPRVMEASDPAATHDLAAGRLDRGRAGARRRRTRHQHARRGRAAAAPGPVPGRGPRLVAGAQHRRGAVRARGSPARPAAPPEPRSTGCSAPGPADAARAPSPDVAHVCLEYPAVLALVGAGWVLRWSPTSRWTSCATPTSARTTPGATPGSTPAPGSSPSPTGWDVTSPAPPPRSCSPPSAVRRPSPGGHEAPLQLRATGPPCPGVGHHGTLVP